MPARRRSQTRVRSKLAEVRVAKGVTQVELAGVTGISLSSLVRLEQQRIKNPPLGWFVNCAIALGVELEEVLDVDHLEWHGSLAAPSAPPADWFERREDD